ncbi:MAG TPA: DUF4149 domain-containing protein, partial [Pyrinomonadaceae bacterium]|nr:DUF4149 domain-containing protein [Pyrinomonadaceae bacterium]
IWLGAAVFFIAVAQSAFAVLPQQRELAGAVVNRTLSVLNYGGLVIGVLVLLTSWIVAKNTNKFLLWTERFLLLLIAAVCAVSQFVVGLMLMSVRGQMGGRPIDEIAADDPLRAQFNYLHQWSEWLLMAAMIASLVAFFIIANRRFGGSGAAKADPLTPYNFEKEFKI